MERAVSSVMRVLIVSTDDLTGGAGKAAYRLHRALLKFGVQSHMLVQNKVSADSTVEGRSGFKGRLLSRVRSRLDRLLLLGTEQAFFSPGMLPSSSLSSAVKRIKPDIVNIHWVNGGFCSMAEISRVQQPMVVSLHDMWAFTAGCHYAGTCKRYESECNSCPGLKSTPLLDLSSLLFHRKRKYFQRIPNLVINGLSGWIASAASKSSIHTDRDVVNLPNCIDTNLYKPLNRNEALKALGLRPGRKYILFGAAGIADERKGYGYLEAALQTLELEAVDAVFVGQPPERPELPIPYHIFGEVRDEQRMAALYSVADVVVVPSIQENLSNMIMEAMSCGTPVVAFDIGGNADLIKHLETGYLVRNISPESLAVGISFLLDSIDEDWMSNQCISHIRDNFSEAVVAKRYCDLFASVIVRNGNPEGT